MKALWEASFSAQTKSRTKDALITNPIKIKVFWVLRNLQRNAQSRNNSENPIKWSLESWLTEGSHLRGNSCKVIQMTWKEFSIIQATDLKQIKCDKTITYKLRLHPSHETWKELAKVSRITYLNSMYQWQLTLHHISADDKERATPQSHVKQRQQGTNKYTMRLWCIFSIFS